MAELYPPHLQSTAASIFNWGRIISFFSPLITASIAQQVGMPIAMSCAALAFTLAALGSASARRWRPETRKPPADTTAGGFLLHGIRVNPPSSHHRQSGWCR
jgi:dipeptide/tripeptide permease